MYRLRATYRLYVESAFVDTSRPYARARSSPMDPGGVKRLLAAECCQFVFCCLFIGECSGANERSGGGFRLPTMTDLRESQSSRGRQRAKLEPGQRFSCIPTQAGSPFQCYCRLIYRQNSYLQRCSSGLVVDRWTCDQVAGSNLGRGCANSAFHSSGVG